MPQLSKERLGSLAVKYGNVTVGESTASIRVTVEKDHLRVGRAERFFCDARLEVQLDMDRDPEQEKLPGIGETPALRSVADVKSYTSGARAFGFTLSFARKSIALAELTEFCRAAGQLDATYVGKIPDDDGAAGESQDGDDDDTEPAGG